ncbi:MAG: response regulator transcription factor [Bacteroidetes bacterium]|nr:response regulator transcription factor [Bacteroidota bacterium]MBS1931062.1 response regulator transcription factor [Bacteroidota bacterium]
MKSYQVPVNILIADDHRLITDGISKILEEEKIIGKIHTANDGSEAVNIALAEDIDCVIMDINMPVMNGLEAVKRIKQEKPYVKIIAVSMHSDASVVNKMLKAGADGYINKDTGKTELLTALGKVMRGEKYISPEISNNLFVHLNDRNVQSTEGEKPLTPREIEIIRYIADGHTNQEIAQKLFLSVVTVDTHRKNILAKLQLKNSAALVKYAAEHKLL